MATVSPYIQRARRGSYLEITARATVNRHLPEIVVYVIDSGRAFHLSDGRAGIGSKLGRYRSLAAAERRALAIVTRRFNRALTEHKKRARLYG